jgi:hypothetical protein
LAIYGRDNSIPGVLIGEPKFKLVGHLIDDHVECTCIWFGVMAKKKTKTGILSKVTEVLEEKYFVGEENQHRIQNESGCSILGYT